MKRCYLQKKICATIQDFRKTLVAIIWYSRITLWHSVYEKNTLVSIFKWLVPWKRGLPRPKFSFENLSPSPTLSYTITKKPKRVFLWILIDSVVFVFHSDRTLFRFFIDRILFRVLSDRVFSDSSVMGSSSGSAVLLGHQCSFFAMSLFLLSNRVATFFFSYQKQMFCFTLNSQNEVSLTCFNHINKLKNTTLFRDQIDLLFHFKI